jgi:15-cis-phytoene synthase
VRFEDLLGTHTDERLAALFRFQLERIRAYHEQALNHLPDADRHDQRRQRVLAELVLARLAEVEAEGFRLLAQETRLTPLTKFRLAWRVLRRERRRHKRS